MKVKLLIGEDDFLLDETEMQMPELAPAALVDYPGCRLVFAKKTPSKFYLVGVIPTYSDPQLNRINELTYAHKITKELKEALNGSNVG